MRKNKGGGVRNGFFENKSSRWNRFGNNDDFSRIFLRLKKKQQPLERTIKLITFVKRSFFFRSLKNATLVSPSFSSILIVPSLTISHQRAPRALVPAVMWNLASIKVKRALMGLSNGRQFQKSRSFSKITLVSSRAVTFERRLIHQKSVQLWLFIVQCVSKWKFSTPKLKNAISLRGRAYFNLGRCWIMREKIPKKPRTRFFH